MGARLFVAALLVYIVCPPFASYDSYYLVPTALNLLRHGHTWVDGYVEGAPEASRYALDRLDGHWYSMYPIAIPVLTAPLIFVIGEGAATVARFVPGAASRAPHPAIATFLSGDLAGRRRYSGADLRSGDRGATSIAANHWSAVPVSVDDAHWRIWDRRDPQFLRGLR